MLGNAKTLIQYLLEQDQEKTFEVKEYKEKRNSKQNAKYWKLLTQLSLKTKIGIEELHFNMLKNYSPRYEIMIPAEIGIRGIEYYEKKRTIRKDKKLFNVYYVYTPSHELNKTEFAILLQGLCDECKEQEIETLSPQELGRLRKLIENEE